MLRCEINHALVHSPETRSALCSGVEPKSDHSTNCMPDHSFCERKPVVHVEMSVREGETVNPPIYVAASVVVNSCNGSRSPRSLSATRICPIRRRKVRPVSAPSVKNLDDQGLPVLSRRCELNPGASPDREAEESKRTMEPRHTTAQDFFAAVQSDNNAPTACADNHADDLFRRRQFEAHQGNRGQLPETEPNTRR